MHTHTQTKNLTNHIYASTSLPPFLPQNVSQSELIKAQSSAALGNDYCWEIFPSIDEKIFIIWLTFFLCFVHSEDNS